MSAPGLRFLDQKCPNLQSLVMSIENHTLNFSAIPSRLTMLELRFDSQGGHSPPHDWWTKVTHEKFPNLKSLAISGRCVSVRPLEQFSWFGNRHDHYIALRMFLCQIGEFRGLQHLELNILGDCATAVRSHINPILILEGLNPVANKLESFCILDKDGCSISVGILKYIGDQMKMLKYLKTSLCIVASSGVFVSCARNIHGCFQTSPTFVF